MNNEPKLFRIPYNINRKMEGKEICGVKYVKKIFVIHERSVEGVFPIFNGIKITLSKDMDSLYFDLGNTDNKFYNGTMLEATKALAIMLENNPQLKESFTEQQLKDIYELKKKITGKTWHHYEELSKDGCPIMQLVDEDQHSMCSHTGGSYTWNIKKFQNKYGEEWENAK